MKRYSELIELTTFRERFEYLKTESIVGDDTFGSHRYLNQMLYHSDEWKRIRNFIITRDLGNDMAMHGYPIGNRILIHHINPITINDVIKKHKVLLDPENLVCVSFDTHNAIHYGNFDSINSEPVERSTGDTKLW